MQRIKLILLLFLYSSMIKAELNIPLPSTVPDAQPGEGIVAAMAAQEALQTQHLQNQLLAEKIALMKQQSEQQNQSSTPEPRYLNDTSAPEQVPEIESIDQGLSLIGAMYSIGKKTLTITVDENKIISQMILPRFCRHTYTTFLN